MARFVCCRGDGCEYSTAAPNGNVVHAKSVLLRGRFENILVNGADNPKGELMGLRVEGFRGDKGRY